MPETPWRGAWGAGANRPPPGGDGRAADRAARIGVVVDVMKESWDLPADCNEGELFAYAEQLCDRILAGESRDALTAFLADVQAGSFDTAARDAARAIVDRSLDLVARSA